MKVTSTMGMVHALVSSMEHPEPRIVHAAINPSSFGYKNSIMVDGVDYPDYDERFDVYFHMSDDGFTVYSSCRVLNSYDDMTHPSLDEARMACMNNSLSMVKAVMEGNMCAEDLSFGMRFLSDPVWVHQEYVKNDYDINETQRYLIGTIWDHVWRN